MPFRLEMEAGQEAVVSTSYSAKKVETCRTNRSGY
jgi:hypothetical protein